MQSLGCSTRQDKKEPIKGKGILYVNWAVYINASGPFLEVGLIFLIVDRCMALLTSWTKKGPFIEKPVDLYCKR